MLLGTKKTLYDHMTEALLGNSMSVSQIQEFLDTQKIPATVQGIYKALRELIAEDVVVKQKKNYSINSFWRKKLEELISIRPPFKLSPGEYVSYRFMKLDHLDMFWKHIITDIQAGLGSYPVFHGNPHNFWYLVPNRKHSEEKYRETLSDEHKQVFTLVGGTTELDKKNKIIFNNKFQQFHFDTNYPFNRRDHLSVIGPYIITTRVSVSLARVTDRLYETCFTEQELAEKLEPEFKKYGTVVMTVEHNEEKAKAMRKRMSKDFHIPRELRETFDLF